MLDVAGKGYAEDFLLDRGFDVLAVKCARNNWFQDLSREALAELIGALPARYDQIVTYGSSMGGYAALYFAGCVGAAAVTAIALSPQFSVDPAVPPHEPRWKGDAAAIQFAHQPLGGVMRDDAITMPALRWHVVYDPRTADAAHLSLMQEAAPRNVVPVPVAHSGHPSAFMLAESGALSTIFDRIVAGEPPRVRDLVAKNKATSPSYLFTLAQACDASGRPATASALYDRVSRLTDRPDILLEHSRHLYRAGNFKRALMQLERAWPALHRTSHLFAYKAHLQHVAGEEAAARETFEHAIAMEPDFVAFYQSERHLFKSMLDKQAARMRMLESALSRARDELALKRGAEPGKLDLKLLGQMILLPIAIAGLIVLAARLFGIY